MGKREKRQRTSIQADEPQLTDNLDCCPCLGHFEALSLEHLSGLALHLQTNFDDFQGVGEDHLLLVCVK